MITSSLTSKWRLSSTTLFLVAVLASIAATAPAVIAQDGPVAVPAKKATDKSSDAKDKGKERSGVDRVMDRAKLLMDKLKGRERKVDPFGMSMDPEEALEIVEEVVETAPRQTTTLEEAVARFTVSGVVPKRREVIVGARSLGIGDRVLIEHRDVRFQLTIVEVTAQRISLKDQETGEIASVDLGIIPEDLSASSVAGKGEPAPVEGIMAFDSIFEVDASSANSATSDQP